MSTGVKEAVYLYCLGRSALLPNLEGKGVDGENPLFLRSFKEVVAVLSKVSLEEFCGPSAESSMKDLSWIAPRACRHEEVIEQAMCHSAVLPARFGALFSSINSLDEFLKVHHESISRFLDIMADKEEWSVKGIMDRARANEEILSIIIARETGHLASLSPGMRYFQEERIKSSAKKELNCWVKEVCKEVANDLGCCASDFRKRKVLSRDATGMDRDMVVNWSFLVRIDVNGDFRSRINKANVNYEHQGLVFQLTGPWPPYSFCPSLEMEDRG